MLRNDDKDDEMVDIKHLLGNNADYNNSAFSYSSKQTFVLLLDLLSKILFSTINSQNTSLVFLHHVFSYIEHKTVHDLGTCRSIKFIPERLQNFKFKTTKIPAAQLRK